MLGWHRQIKLIPGFYIVLIVWFFRLISGFINCNSSALHSLAQLNGKSGHLLFFQSEFSLDLLYVEVFSQCEPQIRQIVLKLESIKDKSWFIKDKSPSFERLYA